jgi:cytochrome c biogenesis protein CcmG/thiol:disulfide interchange protein DsbE
VTETTDTTEPTTSGSDGSAGAPARRRISKRWIAIAVIAVSVGLMAYVFNGRFGQDPRLVDSPLIGQPLAALTLDHLEEEGALDFSDLRGEILVINFWASWCFPCRAEHPVLTAASEVYQDRDVHFIGIVYQDREASAIGFLDDFGRGVNYSYVVDPESRATVELGVFGIPETYFVDRDGIIRGKVQGEVNANVLIATIEDRLAGREPEL